ncbi:hypothetical protein [Catenovulum sediminis]|uniref:Uncharacterized protein n=1 Tax=Catenovulum sediminis TaxID=1740262 RepID=A0ABV1RHD1_9ALTE
MKTPNTIYLIPNESEDDLVWCDVPAPTEYHKTEEAVKYIKAQHIDQCLITMEDSNKQLAQENAELRNKLDALNSKRLDIERLSNEYESQISDLRAIKFQRFHDKECWIWQGDGEDYPESLGCPVVMKPEHLREMLAKIETFEEIVNNSTGVAGFHQNGDVAEWGEFDL